MQKPLILLGFSIISVIDTGKYEDITADEVTSQIRSGNIFDFLRQRLGKDIDLSILATRDREAILLSEWQSIDNVIVADSDWGIKNMGLTLLIAYVLESLNTHHSREAC